MIGLALYFLAAFGLAFVLGASKISLPFRLWLAEKGNTAKGPGVLFTVLVTLLECAGCLGWWTGLVVGWFWGPWVVGLMTPVALPLWGLALLFAFATSATNMLFAKQVGML